MYTMADIRSILETGEYTIVCGDDQTTVTGERYTLEQWLHDAWYKPIAETMGVWEGQQDAGYLVCNMTPRAALECARRFQQTCVLSHSALWYPEDGKVVPLDTDKTAYGTALCDVGNDYTMVRCSDGVLFFTVPTYEGTAKERLSRWSDTMHKLAPTFG